MRKIILFLFTAAILIPLGSCSKDDILGGGNSYKHLIVGKWQYFRSEKIDGGSTIIISYDMEFYSNKTCVVNYKGDHPYSISGNEISITEVSSGTTWHYTIKTLTKSELSIIDNPNKVVHFYRKK